MNNLVLAIALTAASLPAFAQAPEPKAAQPEAPKTQTSAPETKGAHPKGCKCGHENQGGKNSSLFSQLKLTASQKKEIKVLLEKHKPNLDAKHSGIHEAEENAEALVKDAEKKAEALVKEAEEKAEAKIKEAQLAMKDALGTYRKECEPVLTAQQNAKLDRLLKQQAKLRNQQARRK